MVNSTQKILNKMSASVALDQDREDTPPVNNPAASIVSKPQVDAMKQLVLNCMPSKDDFNLTPLS